MAWQKNALTRRRESLGIRMFMVNKYNIMARL
jgi:hypothetical protein